MATIGNCSRSTPALALMLCASGLLTACSGGGVSNTDTSNLVSAYLFTVGGSATGLSGSGLVLQNNGSDNLTVTASGAFTFATPLTTGDSYNISVLTQPSTPNQTCVVTNASGTVALGNITGISVTCADKTALTDTIGGSVVGLLGSGLVLQNDGGDNLALSANGNFAFATSLAAGMPYYVTVLSPPINPYQNCAITNGSGTTAAGDVNNVVVSCKTNTNPAFQIGGTITGVSSAYAVVLQDNARDNLTVSANGPFTFATPIPTGSSYNVTASSVAGPQSQTCTFTNASGTVGTSGITNIAIACKANLIVTLSVSGLVGSGLVLQDNGADALAITSNGAARFATALPSGSTYNVTVLQQPQLPAQNCVVNNGTGTITPGANPNISVVCSTSAFTIGGNASGLAGIGLVLKDNGGNNLPVTANGAFVFSAPVASGAAYAVTVAAQPSAPTHTCAVTAGTGSGTVTTANITTVAVTCTTNTYTVGGSTSGLAGTGLVLQDNGGDNLPITGNGTFDFATPVASGAAYAVTVLTQPSAPTQTCSVAAGTGTVAAANITTVTVTCSTNAYAIGGSTSGLVGAGLVLQDNGGNNLPVTANGAFVFSTPIASGSAYAVTILTQPTGQTCTVTNGTGTVAAANVTTVAVACVVSYTVGGTVAGLLSGNSGVTLQENGGSNQTITASGTFTFLPGLPSGSAYSVTVLSPPTGYYCVVANGSGTITNASITNVAVTCGVIGAFMFVPNSTDDTISSFYVDQNSGALVPLPGAPVGTGTTPVSIVAGCTIAGTLGSLYVANSGSSDISQYGVNLTTGVIASVGAAVSVAPNTTPAYIDSVNSTTPCFPIALDTNGTTGYASSFIEAAGNGTLSAGAGSPFEVGVPTTITNPIAATNLQSGGTPFELIADENTGSVYMYEVGLISPDVGFLNSAGPPSTGNANALPNAIVVLPSAYISGDPSNGSSAPFVYLANRGQGNISAYNFQYVTFAALNSVAAAVGTLSAPDALATAQFVSASNVYTYYLYVADGGDSTLSAFAINTIPIAACPTCLLGGLTQINADAATSAQTIATGGTTPVALSVVVLPLGSFLYAVNQGSNNVSVFSISATTGALTPVTGSPFPTGAAPSSVAVWPVP